MSPHSHVHPLERAELTVEKLFEDLASARQDRLRGWASHLDGAPALARGSFVLAQAAAVVEQVAATIDHPSIDPIENCALAQRMIRVAARFEQASAESGADLL